MRLYHLWLSGHCRKVRLMLGEKQLIFEMILQKNWQRDETFLALNPKGELPVLIDDDIPPICGSQTICEYLDEVHGQRSLLGDDAKMRAEVRRLVDWFDTKFHNEVSVNLVDEKVMKRFSGRGEPCSAMVRAGGRNIHIHMAYLSWIAERRNWLAGDMLTLADLTAAAHLSTLDYMGDIPWENYPEVKNWYVRIKSRPSFRSLLSDYVPGVSPSPHYSNLDF